MRFRTAATLLAATTLLTLVGPSVASAAPAGAGQGPELTATEVQAVVAAAGSVTRSEVLARAQTWVDARIPYSQGAYYNGYRTDCSGYVSMAWSLPSSLSTVTLPNVSHPIAKEDLRPGDIMLNGGPGTSGDDGHVAIFERWTDASRSSYLAYEQAGPNGSPTSHHVIPYPYFGNDTRYKPYRYNEIVDDVATGDDAPSVVVEANGAMQVFAGDRNTGKLSTTWQSAPGSNWSGWTLLDTQSTGTPSSHVDNLGQMNVFTRRGDGHLIHLWQDGPNGAINKGADLGGDFSGDPVVVTKADNTKVVFLRGTDGRLWHKWQSVAGGAFSASALVRSDLGTVTGKPSVLVGDGGKLTVFVTRADGHLVTAWQDAAGGAFTWADLGGDFSGDPVAVKKADGTQVVFVRGTDGRLWHKWQSTPGGSFSASALVKSDFGQVVGSPAVTLSGDLLQVFARRTDGHLITAWQSVAGGAFSSDDIGGNLAADPAIGRLPNGAMSAFARFADGSVMTTWQDTPGAPFRKTWSFLAR